MKRANPPLLEECGRKHGSLFGGVEDVAFCADEDLKEGERASSKIVLRTVFRGLITCNRQVFGAVDRGGPTR